MKENNNNISIVPKYITINSGHEIEQVNDLNRKERINNLENSNGLKFDILLDLHDNQSVRGIANNVQLLGALLHKESAWGAYWSINAVADNGLIPVPTYLIGHGRTLSTFPSATWSNQADTHAERNIINLTKKYGSNNPGLYIVDIQHGGLFVNRPEHIFNSIEKDILINGDVIITRDMKNLLFGEKMVYGWNNCTIAPIKPDFFGNYEEFLEASNDPDFLSYKNNIADGKDNNNNSPGRFPTYVVLRRVDKIPVDAKKQGERFSLEEQMNNPDLIIPLGGKNRTMDFLEHLRKDMNWTNFGMAYHRPETPDTGNRIIFHPKDIGVGKYLADFRNEGYSVGMDPDALKIMYKDNVK